MIATLSCLGCERDSSRSAVDAVLNPTSSRDSSGAGVAVTAEQMRISEEAAASAARVVSSDKYLFDLLAKPTYRKAWNTLFLGEEDVDDWLAQYSKTKNGPAGVGKMVAVGDAQYQVNTVCKTHECGDNQFYVLFSPNGDRAWGLLLIDRERERFFGNPDEEKKNALRTSAYE